MNQPEHIQQQFDKCTSQQIESNRLRLRASIDAVLYFMLQGCALRGLDESINSKNRGNFIEFVKRFARYNANVAENMVY
ncbi:hypothetical protein RJ640_024820 [Escallonia rubra]|uniref:DUF4371 domain-containing protein n=1 Tax=Escallonia rubra TaxID=112253 RepID=A0AA88QRA1_9ASTE|nr:hypothetical protein RJ640_024820 [Escallonia rubra]